jgi:hypothetical protein
MSQSSYVDLYVDPPKLNDAVTFAILASHAIDNGHAMIRNRDARRGGETSGILLERDRVREIIRLEYYNVEIYAPTRDEVKKMVAGYMRQYLPSEYETRFGPIRFEFDGYVARGERKRRG